MWSRDEGKLRALENIFYVNHVIRKIILTEALYDVTSRNERADDEQECIYAVYTRIKWKCEKPYSEHFSFNSRKFS